MKCWRIWEDRGSEEKRQKWVKNTLRIKEEVNEMLKNLRRSRKWEEKIKMSKKYFKNEGRCEWNVEESEKIEEVRRKDKNE